MQLRFIEAVFRQIGGDVFNESCQLLILQPLDETADLPGICRRVLPADDRPVLTFARQHGLALTRSINCDPIKNVCVDPDQMAIAQVIWFGVENLLDLLWQRVNESTRGEPHIQLVFFFFRHTADLQQLSPFIFLCK